MRMIDAYKYVAATATLDKWLSTGELCRVRGYKRGEIASKAFGIVYHDRYLCADTRIVRRG